MLSGVGGQQHVASQYTDYHLVSPQAAILCRQPDASVILTHATITLS